MDRSFLNQSLQLPFKIHHNYYNSFYGLRLCVQIKEKPVELSLGQGGEMPVLYCQSLTPSPPFIPILTQLCKILGNYGVSSILRCFSDPRPLVEVELDEVKGLLLHLDDLAAHLWVIVSNAFIEESRRKGLNLVKDDDEGKKWMGTSLFPRMHHYGNSCRVDVFLFCPKYSKNQRLIEIVPVTLANYEYATKEMVSSFVFNFQSAISSFMHQSIAGMDLTTERESVSLEDLQEEFKDVVNWFHMGIVLKISSSKLLSILFNYKQTGACLSELINLWYYQSKNAMGDSGLSWSEVTGLMLAIGRQSLADNIARRYGVIPMLDYLDVAQSSTLEISPISDQDIMDTFEELKERDCKLSEKLKTIAVYEQERRVLVISFEQMKEALEKTTTEIRSFIQMKQEKRAESEKTKSGIAALKDILESITEEKKSATHELDEMISSQSNLVMELEDKIVLLNEGLRVVKMQAMSEYDSLVKEYDLLLAKSQQIHHLHKVISLLQAKTMQPAIIVDHLLQQEASKRAKSAYAAFEVQLTALEEEIQERMEEAQVYFKEEEVAQKQINNAQKNLAPIDAVVDALKEKFHKNEENTEDKEELTLLQWLQEIEESIKSREALLDAKENRWSKERIRYGMGSEGGLMKEVLEVLSETCPPEDEDTDTGIEETTPFSVQQPSMPDCKLTCKPDETLAVKLNHYVLLSLDLPEKVKLDQRKEYTVEIHSLANNSVSSCPAYMDSSASLGLAEKFQPTIRGRHRLTVHLNNKRLKGAPTYNIYAMQNPHTFGYPVRMIEGLSYPYYIESLPETSLMIMSECKGAKVSVIEKSTGKKTTQFGSTDLRLPCGVAVDRNGATYIVDSGNHCVNVLNKDGTLMNKVGGKGNAYTKFCYPYGLGISPSAGTINVCDHSNDRIQVFTSDMKFVRGVYAISPFDIAFNSHGAMYVSDKHNHLVAVFNEKYQCINSIGGKGTEEGKLLEPRDIAIDNQDNLYVVEELNHRVTIFDSQGQFVTCFGQEGRQPGEFSFPQGIAVDDDGYVYVCDMLNNRIQVF